VLVHRTSTNEHGGEMTKKQNRAGTPRVSREVVDVDATTFATGSGSV
jgi:hypothetical protein